MGKSVVRIVSPSASGMRLPVKRMVEELVVLRRNVVRMICGLIKIITAETRIHPLDKVLYAILHCEVGDEKEENDNNTF